MNWNKIENLLMFVVTVSAVVQPLLVLCSPAIDSTTSPYNLIRKPEYLSHSLPKNVSCPDEWKLESVDNKEMCYKYFSNELSFAGADLTCSREKAHLAVAENKKELDFLMEHDWKDLAEYSFWIGYQYTQLVNGSSWLEASQNQTLDQELTKRLNDKLRESDYTDAPFVKANNTGFERHCVLVKFSKKLRSDVVLSNCKNKNEFLCQQDADVEYICLDRADRVYKNGERFRPKGLDVCTTCTCGESMNCMSAMCAQPSCNRFIPDDMECCKYTCIWDKDENENGKTGLESNMQWMLTMAFSFFILGVVLIMIYRMRQKRMAYLRFRRERLQQLSQVDFEPGSGPPPPPDDFDGSGFREPPPPYIFYKDQHADRPPPYEQLTITMPTVNANNRKIEDTRETVMLLGDSEPSTPSVQSADLTLSETTGATAAANHQNNNNTPEENTSRLNSTSEHSSVTTPTGSETSQESNSSTSTVFQTTV
ncbi:integral membrane protein DGCR2/IDD-like [Anneissia japonica]|uniref:integral membrane protein DGCR2/IDD-like n=1 Tax=Anneissia japonica TaxID=1529436 RepID=UPI001425AF10|nr:integral membrane protein DGCR2/IDD-like [Anneissia japonica]